MMSSATRSGLLVCLVIGLLACLFACLLVRLLAGPSGAGEGDDDDGRW